MTDKQVCPLGDDCDLTTAYMAGRASADDRIRALEAERDALKEALESKVQYVCPDDDAALNYIEASYGSDARCAVSCIFDASISAALQERKL